MLLQFLYFYFLRLIPLTVTVTVVDGKNEALGTECTEHYNGVETKIVF